MSTAVETFGPAPWGPHDLHPDDVVDAECHLVASVYGRYESIAGLVPKPMTCRAEANRRLIMAAPEMLAALEAICAEAESWHNNTHDPDGYSSVQCDSICALIPAMQAAIRKARGEQ